MIHQFIFAHPKPGMSEADFQNYWLTVHGPNFAARIPQIRKYMIDTRIPFGPEPDDPMWSGVAEIWLTDEHEQLASLQTPEFLEGARLDEPKWAAFWRTLVLDTDANPVVTPPSDTDGIKLLMLTKRRNGTTVEQFRNHCREEHGGLMASVPGVRGYQQGFTRDGFYTVGEAALDVVFQLWFDDVEALEAARQTTEWDAAIADLNRVIEPRYLHQMVVKQHWIIGPEAR